MFHDVVTVRNYFHLNAKIGDEILICLLYNIKNGSFYFSIFLICNVKYNNEIKEATEIKRFEIKILKIDQARLAYTSHKDNSCVRASIFFCKVFVFFE